MTIHYVNRHTAKEPHNIKLDLMVGLHPPTAHFHVMRASDEAHRCQEEIGYVG